MDRCLRRDSKGEGERFGGLINRIIILIVVMILQVHSYVKPYHTLQMCSLLHVDYISIKLLKMIKNFEHELTVS